MWPSDGKKVTVKRSIGLVMLFLCTPALLAAEIEVICEGFREGNILLALGTANELASGTQFYVTTLTFVIYRQALAKTIRLIGELNDKVSEELGEVAIKEITLRKDRGKKAHRLFILTLILLQSWSAVPIMNFLLFDIRAYIVHTWVPFSTESLPGFMANFSFQTLVCWNYCVGFCIFASLFVCVSEMIFGHLAIFRHRLETLKFGTRHTLRDLVACINYQSDILEICKGFRDLTALPLIVNCLFTVILLCLILVNFTLMQKGKYDGLVNLITEAQLVLLFLGTYCWYCNEITFQFAELLRPLYKSDWYNGTEVEKIIALNVMIRTRTPMYFGSFIKIDMTTFIDVLKGAFSYYNVIIAVKD